MKVRLEKNGAYWRAVWTDSLGKRQTQGLGAREGPAKVSPTKARELCREIEHELVRNPEARSLDRNATLGQWIKAYTESRSQLAAGTVALDADTGALLIEHFGEGAKVSRITPADADAWLQFLGETATFKGGPMSPHTIAGHLRRARAMWSQAQRYGVVMSNPFQAVKHKTPAISHDWHRLDEEQIEKVIAACPSVGWRVLVGLCAYAGLRRGEALAMTFDRWRSTERKLLVPPIKVSGRECLLVPRLDELIQEAFDAADEGQKLVAVVSGCNLNRDLEVIIRRAGLEPWAKGFHTMRKWRATTWGMVYPEWVVDRWMGHSMTVARTHYRAVPDDLYGAAAKDEKDEKIAELEAQLAKLRTEAGHG